MRVREQVVLYSPTFRLGIFDGCRAGAIGGPDLKRDGAIGVGSGDIEAMVYFEIEQDGGLGATQVLDDTENSASDKALETFGLPCFSDRSGFWNCRVLRAGISIMGFCCILRLGILAESHTPQVPPRSLQ
ncbi:MAG: hypothetical protein K2Z81_16160 [Cyanobacteria bacterium]|nr:hypothetical protein [Cyanobacteriota bacterium]